MAIKPASLFAIALAGTMATPLSAQSSSTSQQLAELRAQMEAMNARIAELESELARTEAANTAQDAIIAAQAEKIAAAPTPGPAPAKPATEIAFKGAPEIKGEGGWSFKPRGRLMFDAGITDAPDSTGRDDGFGNEGRRLRLGVEGAMPGGFGYKAELEFAGNETELVDAYLNYGKGSLEVIVGQHNNFQSLDELTSSLHSSFIERAAFTDAFGFERRLGVSLTYAQGMVLAQAGAFTDNIADTGSNNRGIDGRLVVMPKLGNAQLHLGGSLHYNHLGTDGDSVRYRQRPFVHFTGERFVNTGTLPADSETGYGLEAAVLSGRFHAAAEGFWQKVNLASDAEDPTFFGGYAEIGYFLTKGDTRGYKGGKWDRVRPANPVGKGGIGSVQLNARYDYLDLSDAGIVGGVQEAWQAALLWKPTAYTLLSLNYGIQQYEDAVHPAADGDRDYSVDAFGVRAQIDF